MEYTQIYLMKNVLFHLITALVVQTSYCQNKNITTENYYNYEVKSTHIPISTGWLQRHEIVPIIISELDKFGFKYNSQYLLYKPDNTSPVILDVYSSQLKFGFIYKTGHFAKIDSKHRERKFIFDQIGLNSKGDLRYTKNIILPPNIYILNENNYWYQFKEDQNEKNDFVDRSTIIEILKSDIRKVLAKYKDLDKALELMKWKPVITNDNFIGFVDRWAKFEFGEEGVQRFFEKNIEYPKNAKRNKIEEEIVFRYEITTTGDIGEVSIVSGQNSELIAECKRVLSLMPKWKPAVQQGKKISTTYIQKIDFKL